VISFANHVKKHSRLLHLMTEAFKMRIAIAYLEDSRLTTQNYRHTMAVYCSSIA